MDRAVFGGFVKIIEKDSPELVDLLSELRDKLTFIASTLHPVLDAAKQSPNLLTEQVC